VIEDACHHAWVKLINRSEHVDRDAVLSWLTTTAVREAWKLDRRERRELSLEDAAGPSGDLRLLVRLPEPQERAEQRELLGQLAQLSDRQQRLVWLRALGLSYAEMSAYTGDTVRTVERQILSATQRMRDVHAERAGQVRAVSRHSIRRDAGRAPARDERGIER
jgi:RNA polymerase sigma factor (sigma-70 family)